MMDATPTASNPSAASRWWNSWRLALRINRREARRAKIRAAFIALTVALPVLLMAAVVTFQASEQPSRDAQLRASIGSATARVSLQTDHPTAQQSKRVKGLLGDAQVTPIWVQAAGVVNDGRWFNETVLMTDLTRGPSRDMVFPISGRLPQRPGEVVVTPSVRRALHGDELQLRVNKRGYRAVVVGVVGASGEVIAHPGTFPQGPASEFLAERSTPFSAAEISRAHRSGLDIRTRDQVSQEVSGPHRPALEFGVVMVMALVGFEIALLTAPAFTVGALRARRSLAQLALNGADRRQVRRVVLGQAVILGWLPATAAVPLGVLAGWAVARWNGGRDGGLPVQLGATWSFLLLALGCALAASMAGALWPTRGSGRLEVINLLRHQPPRDRANRRIPLVALGSAFVLLILQAICVVRSWTDGVPSDSWLRISLILTIAAVVCVMFVVPWVLSMLAVRAGRGPVAARVAARDALRQRSRSVSATSAIIAAFAVLAVMSVTIATQLRTDPGPDPSQPAGTAALYGLDDDPLASRMAAGPLGGATVVPVYYTASEESQQMRVVPQAGAEAGDASGADEGMLFDLLVVRAGDVSKWPFTAAERSVLNAGGVVNVKPSSVHDGKARLTNGRESRPVPAAAADGSSRLGLLMFTTDRTATAWGQELHLSYHLVRGELTKEQSARLREVFPDNHLYNPVPQSELLLWILAAGGLALALAVFSAVSATVLSQAEQQQDLRTMQALGAPAGLTRGVSAAQAGMITAIGSVLGLAIGCVPGVIYAMDRYRPGNESLGSLVWARLLDTASVVPWGWLLLIAALTSVMAAGIAWFLAGGQR